MWQDERAGKLKGEIEALLAPLACETGFYDLVKEPLYRIGRGLAYGSPSAKPWPLLPLMVCEAISSHYEHALPAAAALELLKSAADVFDDIQDATPSDSISARYGSAVATNVATTLLVLGERAIARLEKRGVGNHTIVRVMDVVNSIYTTACAGQHLDLALSSGVAVSEDTYLKIAAMKSASTLECACHIGALLATGDGKLIDQFALFGRNLGMVSQIANDIQGIIRGTDIIERRITLPVIFALTQTDGETHNKFEVAFTKGPQSALTTRQIRDLLLQIGAIHYTVIKMELYKERALDILSEIERVGIGMERLKLFLK